MFPPQIKVFVPMTVNERVRAFRKRNPGYDARMKRQQRAMTSAPASACAAVKHAADAAPAPVQLTLFDDMDAPAQIPPVPSAAGLWFRAADGK